MDVYKLRPESAAWRTISRIDFEADTRCKPPWYQPAGDGKMAQFAVCPACDNPIQLIGLYRLPRGVSRPYGKHTGKSVPGLARLDPATRDACPYFRPRRWSKADRKPFIDGQAEKIIRILIEQFDRVAYILGRDTGIWLSKKQLQKMLRTYRQMEGFLYMGATPLNVPWIFAYMANSFSLYYQKIDGNEKLKQAILRALPHAAFVDGRVTGRPDAAGRTPFLSVDVCFIHHRQTRKDRRGPLVETMKLVVSTTRNGEDEEIHAETIAFDHGRFQRLASKSDHRRRRPDLVELARAELGDLLRLDAGP